MMLEYQLIYDACRQSTGTWLSRDLLQLDLRKMSRMNQPRIFVVTLFV